MTDAILGQGREGDVTVWVHIILRATGLASPDDIGLEIRNQEISTEALPIGFSISKKRKTHDVSFLVPQQWAKGKQNARAFVVSGGRRWFSRPFEIDFGLD